MDDPDALHRCRSELLCQRNKGQFRKQHTFQILLIFDNAPRHPPLIGDTYPNMKVIFLSPSTISLIQPTGPGVRAAYKAYCLRRTFAQAIATAEKTDTVLEGLHV